MATRGRLKAALFLSDEERDVLERYARRGRASRNLSFRARIVVRCASGEPNVDVARALRTTNQTVGKAQALYRLDGLHDEPRPGAERTIIDDQVEQNPACCEKRKAVFQLPAS